MMPSSSACLSRRSRSIRSGRARRLRQRRSKRPPEIRATARGRERGRVGQARQQLGLRQQELGDELAPGAELDEIDEKIRALRQQLEIGRARPGSGDEALELVERLVGVGALPEGVEQHRKDRVKGASQRLGVRDERPAFDHEPQVFPGAVGSAKPVALSAV